MKREIKMTAKFSCNKVFGVWLGIFDRFKLY